MKIQTTMPAKKIKNKNYYSLPDESLLNEVRSINNYTDVRVVQQLKTKLDYAQQTPENLQALREFWRKTGR